MAAAKKEGKVAIIGPVGADRRDVLVEPFQKKYGITVEYFADRGSGIGPRLSAERGAGQYLWDAAITGTTTGLLSLLPGGMLDPMEPALVLPDVKDPKQWRGGALDFVDPGRRFLVMTPSQRGTLFVNPKVTKPQEIKSYKDLLNPKWRKKIVMDDPTERDRVRPRLRFSICILSLAQILFAPWPNKSPRSCETILSRSTASHGKNIPY